MPVLLLTDLFVLLLLGLMLAYGLYAPATSTCVPPGGGWSPAGWG
jgi:hypothetical protein